MINMSTLEKNINLNECKALTLMKIAGETKMYNYLSGNDPDSSYSAENVKNIMAISGQIDWNKIEDKSNALFSIGYSEQGNIIGILTNANALLQDMLVYCSLAEAKVNLREVLKINVGSKAILGKRYAVDGKSPLSFALPVITSGGYKTFAIVIHNKHADKFINILETIDVDALTKEDMKILANDISFISRTQELAIDVAKDKTIQIVDTSQWLNMGIKPANYWLSKQNNEEGWFATDNLSDIIRAKKINDILPEFKIEKMDEERITTKVNKEVITSESISREILKKAVEDYYNNTYKDMLTFSQETSLSIEAKAAALANKELSTAIKPIIMAYRSYMIDNIPKGIDDEETAIFLRKISKEKTERFANVCRNTIYHLGKMAGYEYKDIAMIAYGTDLTEISKNEGKFFRAIMPEEFKILYSNSKTAINKEKLFYVDELTEDSIDEGEEIIVDFVNGSAYDNDGILIARASYKFNATGCKLVFDETSGIFYAEKEVGITLPVIGEDILVRTENLKEESKESVNFIPKSPNNYNLLYTENEYNEKIIQGNLGFRRYLDTLTKLTLLNNVSMHNKYVKGNIKEVEKILNNYDDILAYNLIKEIKVVDILTVNKDSEYEAQYAIINL